MAAKSASCWNIGNKCWVVLVGVWGYGLVLGGVGVFLTRFGLRKAVRSNGIGVRRAEGVLAVNVGGYWWVLGGICGYWRVLVAFWAKENSEHQGYWGG